MSLPKAPASLPPSGISAQTLSAKVDAFLSSRGFRPTGAPRSEAREDTQPKPSPADTPRDFICEDDVRDAMKDGRKLVIGERTIVTPAARELGEANKLFVQAGWPR